MKIYFDGDSFTYGGGLENPIKYRWTKLVCDHFGAEETNLSKTGVSNEWVLRHLFADDNNLEQYDIIFIQLTHPYRNEYWDSEKEKWRTYMVNMRKWHQQNPKVKYDHEFLDWVEYYFKKIYTDKQGMSKELVAYNSILSHLKLLGKPFFISGLSGYSHIKYDFRFRQLNFNKISRNDLHPSIKGHEQIANKVLSIFKEKYEDLF